MEGYIDLHVHSSCSDGTMTPSELVRYAIARNLSAMALTDHDTIKGIPEARQEADNLGLELIPGIEFSTNYRERDVHILGLNIDVTNRYFTDSLSQFLNSRDTRNQKMIALLQENGVDISRHIMQQRFPDAVWTRAHFARYLLDEGYVKTMAEAFEKYIGDTACCYVPREKVTPFHAIRLIHEGNGIASLAHPFLYHFSGQELTDLVASLKKCGLDAIEAIYSTNRGMDESIARKLARQFGLKITGGSDFHGSNKPDIDLGSGRGNLKIPYEIWEKLKKN
ncbi:MAG: PHP domain-containing protein [Ruminococcus sp.]|jgi:predicted metal-dependent phosphoesterase TrpH